LRRRRSGFEGKGARKARGLAIARPLGDLQNAEIGFAWITPRERGGAESPCRPQYRLNGESPFLLAPEIVKRIVEGHHPADWTPRDLMEVELPACWKAQQAMLSIA